jgi:hypothetical protein
MWNDRNDLVTGVGDGDSSRLDKRAPEPYDVVTTAEATAHALYSLFNISELKNSYVRYCVSC